MSSVSQVYKRTEVIGRGKFGIVYKGIHRGTKQVYAIKVLNLDTSEDEVKDVQQEIQFLSHLKQVPNVTHYYGSYLNGTKLWIIMDYCAGGSLRTLLKPGKLDEKYIGVIVREVLIALQYIHKQNVIHRDIKAANVLITNEGKVQLCDFGVAAQLTATSVRRNTMAGTPYWMAPEVIMEGTSYDVKADIWSLGITIYEIATGNPPYCDKEAIRAMQLITKSKPPRLDGQQYSSLLKEIIALCLDENPEERLSAEELLKSKFIKFHKNSSTILLKELISRYLLWREKKSSRESIIMNVEDELEEQEIEVKWDFDSLSSNEYILENDINVNNINLNDEHYENFENSDYDDGVDRFMTGYNGNNYDTTQNATINFTNRINQTSNVTYKNNTVNIGSTLKNDGTKKEAPKSLLHLFEERTDEDDESSHENITTSQYDLPKPPSTVALSTSSTQNTMNKIPKVSTPIKEIEIPSIEDIEAANSQPQTRSRANTLLQNIDNNKISLDPSAQRRPTITGTSNPTTTVSTPISNNPPSIPLPLVPQPSSSNSNPPNITRITPSPKKDNTASISNSPSKLTVSTTSPTKSTTMKAILSPNIQSPLLQPMNAISSSISTPSTTNNSSLNVSISKNPSTSTVNTIKRNPQNLRLQMPTPTTSFPKLLHSTSTLSSEADQDENINQFGVNVSNIPMAMTPLTEKPFNNSMQSTTSNSSTITSANSQPNSISKRKPTITGTSPFILQQQLQQQQQTSTPLQTSSQQQFAFLANKESSSVSSNSSNEGIYSNLAVDNSKLFTIPSTLDTNLFIDSDTVKDKLLIEINGLLSGMNGLLNGLEEKLIELT